MFTLIYYCIYYMLLYFLYTCFFYDVVIITIIVTICVIFILTIFIITELIIVILFIRLYLRNVHYIIITIFIDPIYININLYSLNTNHQYSWIFFVRNVLLIRLYSRNVPQLTQMLLQEFPTFRQDEGMMRWDWKQNSEYYY